MAQTTITEALAEIKTIGNRIEKKRQFIEQYLVRGENVRDPLDNSKDAIRKEMQSISDLEERLLNLRSLIQQSNEATQVSVNGTTRTIATWLRWRREVAPIRQRSLQALIRNIQNIRNQAKSKDIRLVPSQSEASEGDYIVNLDEQSLYTEQEAIEETLGTLDGLLSLKNATTTIEL